MAHEDCTETECKEETRARKTIEDVLQATPDERVGWVIATTHHYLERLGTNLVELQIIDPDDARDMLVLTLKRGLAIIEGRDDEARAIEEQGKARQVPINAKAKERYETKVAPKLAQQERELRQMLAEVGLVKPEQTH